MVFIHLPYVLLCGAESFLRPGAMESLEGGKEEGVKASGFLSFSVLFIFFNSVPLAFPGSLPCSHQQCQIPKANKW